MELQKHRQIRHKHEQKIDVGVGDRVAVRIVPLRNTVRVSATLRRRSGDWNRAAGEGDVPTGDGGAVGAESEEGVDGEESGVGR
ncbi:uncharacterized protein family [Actinidia rufa]|uniref:Uncharacterized protein family n=1 Tax=Actinidia rufa TaxID=165716 RepID=A0A7J0H318_9ERIC|nr:uncharacterized protein family [Actinidia rufa]